MSFDVIIEMAGGYRWTRGKEIISGKVSLNKSKGKLGSSATVILNDPGLELANTIPMPHKNDKIGARIWYGPGFAPELVFSGYLATINATSASAQLQLAFADKAKVMRRKQRVHSYGDRDAVELLTYIIERAELKIDLDKADLSDIRFSQVLQHGETDLELISGLLESVGHSLWTLDDTVIIEKDGATRTSSAQHVFRYGENALDVRFRIAERKGKTTGNVFDFAGNRQGDDDGDAEERPASLERMGLVVTEADFPSFTDEALAKARKSIGRKTKVFEASLGSPDPLPLIHQDDFVTLQGYGARFSGVWRVDGVVHDLTNGSTKLKLSNGGSDA